MLLYSNPYKTSVLKVDFMVENIIRIHPCTLCDPSLLVLKEGRIVRPQGEVDTQLKLQFKVLTREWVVQKLLKNNSFLNCISRAKLRESASVMIYIQ